MTPEEEDGAVEMLTGMMGGDVGHDIARRVLQKHKWDVQKAADAMLEGDRGVEEPPTWQNTIQNSQVDTPAYRNLNPSSSSGNLNALDPQPSAPTVIDLTADDSDLNRSWQLNQAQHEVKFGPTERPPDPSWQMVTTNAPIDTHHEDRSLKDAIQASLADINSEDLEMFPVEDGVRESGKPIALRPESSNITYAALITQALFHVPQVRHSVARLRLPSSEPCAPVIYDNTDRAIFSLVELFTNMDLAQLSSIVDNEVLPRLGPKPWDGSTETLGDLSTEFVRTLGDLIESRLNAERSENEEKRRLFQFQHVSVESRGRFKVVNKASLTGSIVLVEHGDNLVPNDLMSRLSYNLRNYTGDAIKNDVIVDPMELVMFQLKPQPSTASGPGKPTVFPFIYPKYFYLDRFLLENVDLTEKQRMLERDMLAEIGELTKRREFLTHSDRKDTLKDIRTVLHYYEHVAQSGDVLEREAAIIRNKSKLQNILEKIVSNVQEIDSKIEKLQGDLNDVFECPELQKYRYDLRAVFMHTGLPGRKQIYSYVQDNHGVWWKTIDYTVAEVPVETILTDPTGLHLGAGPYLLLYSRHLSEEQMNASVAWPQSLIDAVEESNHQFLSSIAPEVAAKASVPEPVRELGPTGSTSSIASLSFPFSPAVFPERAESQSMDVEVQTQTS
ncbi:hypothetical protein DXG03_009233 [Asterophora parasitica]|uniref:USP domain-containing protein n=1 Tax=Asterophora parasitica TaxID=117018 RepID=A0A9P7G5M6_9AGAR|nr:hypothetical protein DXG03_009233 [Asterophora parasitica]